MVAPQGAAIFFVWKSIDGYLVILFILAHASNKTL